MYFGRATASRCEGWYAHRQWLVSTTLRGRLRGEHGGHPPRTVVERRGAASGWHWRDRGACRPRLVPWRGGGIVRGTLGDARPAPGAPRARRLSFLYAVLLSSVLCAPGSPVPSRYLSSVLCVSASLRRLRPSSPTPPRRRARLGGCGFRWRCGRASRRWRRGFRPRCAGPSARSASPRRTAPPRSSSCRVF